MINYVREKVTGNKTDSLANDLEKHIRSKIRVSSFLYGIAVPNYISMIDRAIESDSKNNATALFMAAMDYKEQKGYYPNNLNQLIPKYFAILPIDPINQREYGYKGYSTKMKVYSLGKNGNDDDGLDDDKFADYLSIELYQPTILSGALLLAQKLNKKVYLCFTTSTGWRSQSDVSNNFDVFVSTTSPMKEIMDKYYVYYKVDVGYGGWEYELTKKYVKGLHCKPIPYYVILDSKGNMLQTSAMDKTGNISLPCTDVEIAHFVDMIKKTSTASKNDLDSIYSQLINYKRSGKPRRRS